jgi:putative transposase
MQFAPPQQLDFVSEVIDLFDPPLRARKLCNKDAFQCLWYALNTGVAWKYVPVTGCTFSAVYKRFQRWVKNDVIQNVWMYLLNLYAHSQLDEDPAWFKTLFIDCTLIKNLAGIDCVGRNPTDRGRLGSKLSVLCDMNRITVGCVLYPANHADCKTVEDTLNAVQCPLKRDDRRTVHVVGDKAYSSKDIRALLQSRRMRQVTDNKRNAKVVRRLSAADKMRLQKRHTIENLFCRLKQFKRIRHRMDALASVFHAEIHAAFCILLVQHLVQIGK